MDTNYLFSALKHCIQGRGSEILYKHHLLFDGVTTYKIITDKFRFGGDRETYKAKLINVIYGTKYYTGYPGGPLQYLDMWEQTNSKYNRLAKPGEILTSDMLIQNFGLKFKVINDTEVIFEQAKGETNTFDELSNALRNKLAQRKFMQEQDAKASSNINSTSMLQAYMSRYQGANNNSNYDDSGWRIEQKLWDALTPEERRIVLARRRVTMRNDNQQPQIQRSFKSPAQSFKPPAHLTTTDTIVKKPEQNEPKDQIPQQYKSNKVTEDEYETSIVEEIANIQNARDAYIICAIILVIHISVTK